MENKIIVATNNKNKTKEIKELFKDLPVTVTDMKEENIYMEIEENGQTFEDNALIKAKAIHDKFPYIILADDSGLEVDYLNGQPGVYSARFAGPQCNDQDNNKKLLSMLDGVEKQKRAGRFVCAMAAIFPDGSYAIVRGACEGTLDTEPRGQNGFGYDPLFIPEGYDKSFGELGSDIKNQISHRSNAIKLIKQEIVKHIKGE